MVQSTNGLTVLRATVESTKVQGRLEQCLKENKGAFASSIYDLYSADKSLQKCNSNAIISECLKAAALNLPISKALGFAYIVVYNNSVKSVDPHTGHDVWTKVPTPTFILGYKGYIQLALRSGQYRTINADVVYDGELAGFDKLSGKIDLSGKKKSEKVIGYFAYYEMLNGFSKTAYVSVEDMAKHALRYSSSMPKGTTIDKLIAKANSGEVSKQVGWMGNFNDMAIKTCIRRLISKYGYMSIEMQQAYTNDIEGDAALEQRTEAIESTKTINIDAGNIEDAEIESVNTETGEVTQKQTDDATLFDENEEPEY